MSIDEEPISLEEAKKKHPDEWIATRVVERDKAGQPTMIQVIYHDWNRQRLKEKVEESSVCIFYSGPIPQKGLIAAL